jgi:hypothetical protein
MADVKTNATVFRFPISWDTRTECIFRLSIREEQQQHRGPIAIPAPPQPLDNDSDSDPDSEDSGSSKSGVHSVSSSSSTRSEDEDITSTAPFLGDTWEKKCEFQPSDPNPTQWFEEHFTATGCSPADDNVWDCNVVM